MTTTQPVERGEVPEAFDEVADRYDLMVGFSPGYHDQLRQSAAVLVDSLASQRIPAGHEPLQVLDIGCGSGASTRALVASLDGTGRPYAVLGVDGSEGMLRQARAKSWPATVRFVQGRAELLRDLPEVAAVAMVNGIDGVDAIFAAYLVRNVPDCDGLLASLLDQLRPGGTLVVHEYSVAGSRKAMAAWTAMCWAVVVPLGWVTSRRTTLYRYLWRSVMDFDSIDELVSRVRSAGFDDVRSHPVGGLQRGIVHTVHARKPL